MWDIDPFAGFKRVQLDNGLTIFVNTWERPWIKTKIIVHSGAREDPAGLDGLAHFVEHLLINNVPGWTLETAKYHFEEIGGTATFGSICYHNSEYYFKVPLEGDNLTFALDLFGRMLVGNHLKEGIEIEREAILSEYARAFPMLWVYERLLKRRQLLFSGSRLERFTRPLASPETVNTIAPGDLQVFYDEHYTPSNISIIALGGIPADELAGIFSKSPFGQEKHGKRNPIGRPLEEIMPPAEKLFIHKHSDYSKQPLERSSIDSFTALSASVNRLALSRACDVLKDIFFSELRVKRKLIYSFGACYDRYPEAYEVCLGGTFKWKALGIIESLMDECLEQAIRDTERIKHHIHRAVNKYKIIDMNGGKILAGAANDVSFLYKIEPLATDRKNAEALTVEEVQSVLRTLERDRRWTIIVHP